MKKLSDFVWEIPKSGEMRVPARIYGSEAVLREVEPEAFQQAKNIACLPGILKYSISMPDIHTGYGFPIGGVVGLTKDEGIVSPGSCGFDIMCGVRLLKTDISLEEFEKKKKNFTQKMYEKIPVGLGGESRLRVPEFDKVLLDGAEYAKALGYASQEDLDFIEEKGKMKGAKIEAISQKALARGKKQLGTTGSGNHFVEAQFIENVFDEKIAEYFGFEEGKICFMIHTGSRGLGHQIASDYIDIMLKNEKKYPYSLPDKQLIGAPYSWEEAQNYLGAMKAAANFAFFNRQIITFWLRELLKAEFGVGAEIVYDHAHNIIKEEKHKTNRGKEEILVYRKGATRAFCGGREELAYSDFLKKYGHPCLIPGSMGTTSYVMVPEKKAETETFGTICHGAGRRMSRHKAKKEMGSKSKEEMEKRGFLVLAPNWQAIAEEMPEAYKDVSLVVDSVEGAGLAKKLIKLKPLSVIKG